MRMRLYLTIWTHFNVLWAVMPLELTKQSFKPVSEVTTFQMIFFFLLKSNKN